jgi:hypothetical protein
VQQLDQVEDEQLAAYARMVARLGALPADHPSRLSAERLARSFVREGRRSRRQDRGAIGAEADAALLASTVTGALDRREDAPLALPRQNAPLGELYKPRRC